MMTCRLLCALLVLALCCCLSVCAAAPTEHTEVKAPVAASPQSLVPEEPRKEIGNSGSPSKESGAEQGRDAGAGPSSTAAGPESVGVSNTLQNHDTDGTPVPEIGTRQSAEEANQEAEDPAEKTTTTTTYAPTTITTTTTKAPTTTTEAPTTTTTSAPSRLREIDGSLSSSAWVCAPLLLAVSALAYTAVG
ncbi:putative mucin TcMUCII [Trypanosoma cruzi]|uniref:Mucin TcMUCII, putative n=2 Tax=Trypanosoma cruzi TaxID=5693 RepID=Q4E100_TRYCC|nr:mucin TcMUCII, putative [Trypanosoma cruzi]EAN98455.1 mucin TcMUCII, putative [Trypanosoma cruzi]PWV12272.1 putative mucin TcMUCII [Trypanosoma cruzi]|eukprot:XP_820306.1 mucin TcMUCII [Trypanosoma cruzi strain CL Brener]